MRPDLHAPGGRYPAMRDTLDMARFAIRLALEDGVSGRALNTLIRQEQQRLHNEATRSRGAVKRLREAA